MFRVRVSNSIRAFSAISRTAQGGLGVQPNVLVTWRDANGVKGVHEHSHVFPRLLLTKESTDPEVVRAARLLNVSLTVLGR